MMIKKWRIKDFDIKAYRTGSQLKSSAEWAYKIIWEGKEIKSGFSRKYDAVEFVKKLVKLQNAGVDKMKEEKQ